jgi:hypothetical protein
MRHSRKDIALLLSIYTSSTDAIVQNLGVDSVLTLSQLLYLLQEVFREVLGGLPHRCRSLYLRRVERVLLHNGSYPLEWK